MPIYMIWSNMYVNCIALEIIYLVFLTLLHYLYTLDQAKYPCVIQMYVYLIYVMTKNLWSRDSFRFAKDRS